MHWSINIPSEILDLYLFRLFPNLKISFWQSICFVWQSICFSFDKVFLFLTKHFYLSTKYFCLSTKYLYISGYFPIRKFPFDKVASSSPPWSLHHILWPRWFQVFLKQLLSDPSGTDLTVVFSSSSSSPSRCKPIVNKQPHSSYFSIATHIKYRFRKLMTRTIQWWPRDDTDKDTHKDNTKTKTKTFKKKVFPNI